MAKAKYIFRNCWVDASTPLYEYLLISESGRVLSVNTWSPNFAKEKAEELGLAPISATKWLILKNGS